MKLTAELRYSAVYTLDDADQRDLGAYGAGRQYLPEMLTVELYSNAHGDAPDPAGLSVTRVVVSGSKVKRDGTPGAVTWREIFSSARALPPEFRAVADELLAELTR